MKRTVWSGVKTKSETMAIEFIVTMKIQLVMEEILRVLMFN